MQNLSYPLHVELVWPCARSEDYELWNLGQAPLPVAARVEGDGFALRPGPCDTSSIGYDGVCLVGVCFSSSTPGTHKGHLYMGGVDVTLAATVLPPVPGLDSSFVPTGALVAETSFDNVMYHPPIGATASPTAALIWRHGEPSVRVVSRDAGTEVMGGFIAPRPDAWVTELRKVRWAAAEGTYAIGGQGGQTINHGLVRWSEDGTLDTSFGADAGLVPLNFTYLYPRSALERQSSGRVLVIGEISTYSGTEIRAFTLSGQIDTAYGAQGIEDLPADAFLGAAVTDALDRTYLRVDTGVLRLLDDGGVDPRFRYTGPADGIALLDGGALLVVAGGGMVVLDESGGATALAIDGGPPLGVPYALQVDELGRIRIITADWTALRYAADGTFLGTDAFEGAVGFACFTDGACAIVGTTAYEQYVAMTPP